MSEIAVFSENAAEIEQELILTGEEWFRQRFVEKVRQNDGAPIMAYAKLCHTFPEARAALCKGVRKIFIDWKKEFLDVQKAKPKSRGTKKEQLERHKARDDTCLASLKEKWPVQYAQMLELVGEAIEKAKCTKCKRTLALLYFISLYKKWNGGDAPADLKAFMKHMKTGKCGSCGLDVKPILWLTSRLRKRWRVLWVLLCSPRMCLCFQALITVIAVLENIEIKNLHFKIV